MPVKKLIVGLGNPGPEYRGQRHNVGFLLVEHLADAWGLSFQGRKHQSRFARGRVEGVDLVLVQPQTFMNASGDAVRDWVAYEGLDPSRDLVVVCDEMQLPLGRLRLRPGGSAGSHNGLKSIIQRLGGQDFPRLRVGVDKPARASQWADWVLSDFRKEEREALRLSFEAAGRGLALWLKEPSLEKVMSKINAGPERPAGDGREGGERGWK